MRNIRASFIVIVVLFSAAAAAQSPEPIRIDQAQSGMLLLKTNRPGLYVPMISVDTKVDINVTALTARATVRQTFHNSSVVCAEGFYVFPLPENAAVDHLVLTVGQRRIEGEIKPRVAAQEIYEAARSEGRKAALVEQHRANIFQVSVASIFPDEKVEVEIAYQQEVQYDSGEFRLRYPMTIAPRYTPSPDPNAKVPAAKEVPVHLGGKNKVDLTVRVAAGVPLADIRGSYHPIDVEQRSDAVIVRLKQGAIAADRDFELVWKPQLGSEPTSAWFTESSGGATYSMVMMMPPAPSQASPLPREVTFVIDRSGSMGGTSMEQARAALVLALQRLRPVDSFNVVEFDDRSSKLFERPVPADRMNVAKAVLFVEALTADGGTEILGALQLALSQLDQPTEAVRQIVFITDGQVSNESAIFDFLKTNLGNARLFTVGIGSAPNSLFMSGAARMGRGTFSYIGDTSEVKEKMQLLFTKLESPSLTNLEMNFGDAGAEVYPSTVPDLYAGEPLIVLIRGGASGSLHISGKKEHATWSAWAERIDTRGSGIEKLWARRKIEALTDELNTALDRPAAERAITDVALAHHLVSEYTSLVAVDVTPPSLAAPSCVSVAVPLNAPAGATLWEGALPQTATSWKASLLMALLMAAAAMMVGRFEWAK